MGTNLNREAYQNLIDENIQELNKFMPEHSLEKKHIIDVLNWSVRKIYGEIGCEHEYIFNPFTNGDWCRLCHKTKPKN